MIYYDILSCTPAPWLAQKERISTRRGLNDINKIKKKTLLSQLIQSLSYLLSQHIFMRSIVLSIIQIAIYKSKVTRS